MTGLEFLAAGVAISAVTSAVSGYAAYQQGQFQADVARTRGQFAAKVAAQNAEIATDLGERSAKAALDAASSNERLFRRDRRRRIASARAALGASGTTLEGTPLELLSDAIATTALDANLIQHGGIVQAEDHRLQARLAVRREQIAGETAIFTGQSIAELQSNIGAASLFAGFGRAGGTLLGGIYELDSLGFFAE